MKPYPPLGLLYLSAWFDKHGMENEVYDTTFYSKTTQKQYLLDSKPSIVAIYANLMTKLNVLELMAFIKSRPELAHTLIVLGGPDVTHNADNYLKSGADLIVIGEGEQTMLEIALLVESLPNQKFRSSEFAAIHGLAMLTTEGLLFKTAPREKIRDIDQLPFPNRKKIDYPLYLNAWKKVHGHNAVSISTQRGCPYTCRWCSTAVYGQSYRRRSAEHVVDEIVWLQQNYDFDLIWFVDDVFTVSHKWIGELQLALKQRQVTVQFECITRADRLTEAVVQTLHEMGCFRVWIGAESGSQRIIDAMDRRVDVQQVRTMIQAAHHQGIQAGTFIMLGYPGETEADIMETVQHLKESNPDLFTITVAYPIKGTGLYETVEDSISSQLDWTQSTDRDIEFKRTYSRKYYDYAVRWTVNSVHLYKASLAGKRWSFQGIKLWAKVILARTAMKLSR